MQKKMSLKITQINFFCFRKSFILLLVFVERNAGLLQGIISSEGLSHALVFLALVMPYL